MDTFFQILFSSLETGSVYALAALGIIIIFRTSRTTNFAQGSIGMFNDTKTIFVSPVMNSGMYQFQRELHDSLKNFDTNGWEWYHPDHWVPHCTIALTKEDDDEAFFQASNYILHEFKKMWGKFVSIGLVKITFPVEEIFTAGLSL